MRTGGKTQTYNVGGIRSVSQNSIGNSGYGRNLGKYELGGVIFGCKNSTIRECQSKQLFGLPAHHFSYVKNISPGLPLFLFNYSDRKLHGIFEASSSGKMCIDPYAWTDDFSNITPYPAQVRIRSRLQCRPLPEDNFGQVIADNFYRNKHFWFELDHMQTNRLMFLLMSSAMSPGTHVPPRGNMKCRNLSRSLPSRETWKKREGFESAKPHTQHFTHMSRRRTGFAHTTSLDGGIRESLETQPVVKEVNEDERKLIYMKLKEIARAWEESQNLSLSDNDDDDDTDEEKNMCFMEKSCLEENDEECYDLPFVDKYTTAQVDDEVNQNDVEEELVTFKKTNTLRSFYLEHNLMKATLEIQYLKDHCTMLEATFNLPLAQNTVIHPSVEFYLNQNDSSFLKQASEGESLLFAMDSFCPSQNLIKFVSVAESSSPILKDLTLCNSLNQNQKKEPLARVSLNNNIFPIGVNGVEYFLKFDMPDFGRWISLPSILGKKFDIAVVQSHGSLYAIGRYNGVDCLKFDLGGFDGCAFVPNIKVFDPYHGAWMIVEPKNHLREYFDAPVTKDICVIEGVKDVEDIVDKF